MNFVLKSMAIISSLIVGLHAMENNKEKIYLDNFSSSHLKVVNENNPHGWIDLLPNEKKEAALKIVKERTQKSVYDSSEEISYGLYLPPKGDAHTCCMRLLRELLERTEEKIRVLDIGCGLGGTVADMAILISNYPTSTGYKGKVYFSEPVLSKQANIHIFESLKTYGAKKIKDLYLGNPVKFPGCCNNASQDSEFYEKFNFIHCNNVIHFLSPDLANDFLVNLFDRLVPGGYVFLSANAPSDKICMQPEMKENLERLIKSLENQKVMKPTVSSYDLYQKNLNDNHEFPGFCQLENLYFCEGASSNPLELHRCFEFYPREPFDAKIKYESVFKSESYEIKSGKKFINFFSAEQFRKIANNHGLIVIDSGYLQGNDIEGTFSKTNTDEIPKIQSTAFIIVQKPY